MLEYAGAFMWQNSIVKLSCLVHKMGFGKTAILCIVSAVCTCFQEKTRITYLVVQKTLIEEFKQ